MENTRLDDHGFPVKEAFPNVHDIYNREAKAYDSAMVERWKTAMEGLLIFAGLFSATVTAFIIEGYRSLKPDSGDLTVALLYQLSQQLALSANGTQISPLFLLPPPDQVPFSPPWTSVAANILWFISLGLSLACAVAATLVQQWARNYIHAIERRPSAERRARMRMYLFEGVERVGMTQIVDGVPALLHLALFLFLLGLIFFIQPINWPLTAVATAVLITSVATYLYATLLPLVAFDVPIQTPLTGVIWRREVIRLMDRISVQVMMAKAVLSRVFKPPLRRTLPPPLQDSEFFFPSREPLSYLGPTLDAARALIARDTTSDAFKQREKEAFTWLVEYLDEDREILPFMEAMPAFIQQAAENHDAQATFSHIFRHPRLRLYTRLPALLRRYHQNARMKAAFAEFYLCVEEEDWNLILSSLVDDLWLSSPPLTSPSIVKDSCPPEVRAQLYTIQATIEFWWISTGHPWYSIPDATSSDRLWPAEFKLAWDEMMQLLFSLSPQIPLHLLPTLSFTKALLNLLCDVNNQTTEAFICRILQDYLPFTLSWLSESSTATDQRSYCAILATIVSAVGTRPLPVALNDALRALLLRCRNMSDSTSLRDLDRLLQKKLQSQLPGLRQIVQIHIDKLNDAGCPALSKQVIMKYRIASFGLASNCAKVMSFEPLNLQHTAPDVQSTFMSRCQERYHYWQFHDFSGPAVDPETGLPEAVLFIESAINVIYTIDALDALQHALELLSEFLQPEYYPYNECALACRGYLQNIIRQRTLLDSVNDRALSVVGTKCCQLSRH